MLGGKESRMKRKRPLFLALVVLIMAALVAVAVAQGAWTSTAGLGSGPSGYVGKGGKTIGSGKGFGESFKAPASTLAHALFAANLIPAAKQPRNIALAGLGRATKKVNYALA